MTYSIMVDLGGMQFAITSPTVDELMEQYEQLEGNPKWVLAKIQEVVPLVESGQYAFRATVEDARETVEPTPAERKAAKSSAWDDDGQWSARKSSKPQGDKDPWDDAPVDDEPSQRRTEPSRGKTRADEVYKTEADRFDRTFMVNLPEAPECHCGVASVRMHAKSQKGSWYDQYRCAKLAGIGGSYKEDCGFKQFP